VVRDRRVRPGRHDGLERRGVGAVAEHQRVQVAADLAFGPAGAYATGDEQLGERPVGDRARLPQQRDLVIVLDRAHRLDGLPDADQLGSLRLLG
jgi:hypothetical protein